MNRRHLPLFAVPAITASILLSGCGSDAPSGDAAPSSPATAGETTVAPEGQAGSDQQAGLSVDDQQGDGSTVVIDTVSAPQGGFVVVSAADGGAVLGWSQVPVGTTDDTEVPLAPALTEQTDLTATLYADTDGNGTFDPGTDQAVPEPVAGDDASDDASDRSDVVDDDVEYGLG